MVQKYRTRIGSFAALAIVFCGLPEMVVGLEPITVLSPNDVPPGFGTGFGASAAISGDYISIGASEDPWNNGNSFGAVYVFRRVGPNWIQVAKLAASDAQYLDQLGWSVAMAGDVIVAGAPRWDVVGCGGREQGAAYVFIKNNAGTPNDPNDDFWAEKAKLVAPSAAHGIGFGFSVAISGNRIVAGSDCGQSAEVFRLNNGVWQHEATLLEPEPSVYHEFGSAVAIDGSRVVVGSHGYNERRGAVYLFAYDSGQWNYDLQLISPGANEMDDFGQSVAISGDFIAAGAPNEDNNRPQSSSGAAYLFDLGDGTYRRFAPLHIESAAYFGLSVALETSSLLIGQWVEEAGTLYEFVPNGWMAQAVLEPTSSLDYVSASISGNYGVVSRQIYVVRNRKTLFDFSLFQNCFGAKSCTQGADFDFNGNDVIDIVDFGEVAALLNGP